MCKFEIPYEMPTALRLRLVSLLYSYAVTPYGQSLSGILYTAAGEL